MISFKEYLSEEDTPKVKVELDENILTTWEVSFDYGPHMSNTVYVEARSEEEAVGKVKKAESKHYSRGIMVNWAKPLKHGVKEEVELDEAGSFSYGAKPPRKGSVAYNAMIKRKEQEKKSAPVEPKDQMVGVGRLSKIQKEEVNLTEGSFVSSSPSTGASVGVTFDVKKNAEKSVGDHVNGQPREHHDVYHEGKHVGHVNTYSAYQDKKPAGGRVVTSRKDVRRWSATVYGGEHNQHGQWYGSTPEHSQHTSTGYKTKKEALQRLANAHKSNPNG